MSTPVRWEDYEAAVARAEEAEGLVADLRRQLDESNKTRRNLVHAIMVGQTAIDEERKRITALQAQLDEAKVGRREAAQILIAEIGAPGPESVVETARRAVATIANLRRQLDDVKDSLEDATDHAESGARLADYHATRAIKAKAQVVALQAELDEALKRRRALEKMRDCAVLRAEKSRQETLSANQCAQWHAAESRKLQSQLDEERARVDRMRERAARFQREPATWTEAEDALDDIAAGCPADSGEKGGQS